MDGVSSGAGVRLSVAAWLLLGISLASFPSADAANTRQIVVNENGVPEGMDFLAEVHEALTYLDADPILDDVLSYGTRIEIQHTDGMTRVEFHVNDGSAKVLFNPRLGIRIDGSRILSPALVLAHELGHIHRGLRGVTEVRNGRFTTAEEIAVIEETEQRVARLIGEPIRRTWSGKRVLTHSVTMGRSPGLPSAQLINLVKHESTSKAVR